MTQVKVVEKVGASAGDVWKRLSDFGGIEVGGIVESFKMEGEGVGAIRTIGVGGGLVVEKLDRHDSAERVMMYSIINEDSPLPVSGYSATVRIADDGDGSCTVDFTGTFEPKGVPEEQAVEMIKGIYAGAIQAARDGLGV